MDVIVEAVFKRCVFGEYLSNDISTYSVSTGYHDIQNFIPEHGAICNVDGLFPDRDCHIVSTKGHAPVVNLTR